MITPYDVVYEAVKAHRDWSDNADECQCGWNMQNPDNDPDVGEIGHVAHEVLTAIQARWDIRLPNTRIDPPGYPD